MSGADTKLKAEDAEAPKMKSARLTVDMVYDPRSDESERAGKLLASMMSAFHQAVTALDLDGCAASSTFASALLKNMECNGHQNCACAVALDYVASVGHAVEIISPDAAAAEAEAAAIRRKGMN